jgi:hypothetical protein
MNHGFELTGLMEMPLSEMDVVMLSVKDLQQAQRLRDRWQRDIYNRFREAKKRFPEFFPCFELRYDVREGLQYSIYFHPLTQHATVLLQLAADFPDRPHFKPIARLWDESGRSELDNLFARFPTQLALESFQPSPVERIWELLKNWSSRLPFSRHSFPGTDISRS